LFQNTKLVYIIIIVVVQTARMTTEASATKRATNESAGTVESPHCAAVHLLVQFAMAACDSTHGGDCCRKQTTVTDAHVQSEAFDIELFDDVEAVLFELTLTLNDVAQLGFDFMMHCSSVAMKTKAERKSPPTGLPPHMNGSVEFDVLELKLIEPTDGQAAANVIGFTPALGARHVLP